MDKPDITNKYSKYLEEFDKIGYSEDRLKIVPNFLNKETLRFVTDWINKSKMSGPIDRANIDNQEVVNILIDSQDKIYDLIYKHYTVKYDVFFQKNALIPTHLVNWNLGKDSPLPVHADCEGPDGLPAVHNGYYRYNLAAICYLNDDYVGGEIFFPHINKTIKPNAGDLILFPGKFKHGVNGVSSGNRYTMLCWFTFDIEKEVDYDSLPYSDTAVGILF